MRASTTWIRDACESSIPQRISTDYRPSRRSAELTDAELHFIASGGRTEEQGDGIKATSRSPGLLPGCDAPSTHVHSINPTSRIAAVALIECPECQRSVSDKAIGESNCNLRHYRCATVKKANEKANNFRGLGRTMRSLSRADAKLIPKRNAQVVSRITFNYGPWSDMPDRLMRPATGSSEANRREDKYSTDRLRFIGSFVICPRQSVFYCPGRVHDAGGIFVIQWLSEGSVDWIDRFCPIFFVEY